VKELTEIMKNQIEDNLSPGRDLPSGKSLCVKTDHDRFLSHPSRVSIYSHPAIRSYIKYTVDAVSLNKHRKRFHQKISLSLVLNGFVMFNKNIRINMF
jgi:hypothetical protein